jgi:ribosomal protein S16
LKHERIAYWRGMGAQVSPRVEKLLTKNPAPVKVADSAAA